MALILSLLLMPPLGARAAAPIWTVHGPKGEVVLFGSFHLLRPGLDWRPPALDAALQNAKELCFEIPEDAAAQPRMAELFRRKAALPKGERLASTLPAPLYARVDRDAESLGINPSVMDGLRPWAVDLLLTDAVARQAGARPEEGVEQSLDLAAPAKVRRCGIETTAAQIALLASLESGGDAAELGVSLDDIEKGPALFTRMMDAYAAGDLATLRSWAVDELKAKSPRTYRRMFVARNLVFARAVEARLRRPGLRVIVVGEGHMLGPDGVPALLRAKGYEVDGPVS